MVQLNIYVCLLESFYFPINFEDDDAELIN